MLTGTPRPDCTGGPREWAGILDACAGKELDMHADGGHGPVPGLLAASGVEPVLPRAAVR